MRDRDEVEAMREARHSLITGEVYHIYSKSIAGFKIFNRKPDLVRMKRLLGYYQAGSPSIRFSYFSRLKLREKSKSKANSLKENPRALRLIYIIAYCIMPTHIHLILKQLQDKGISVFMNNALNSYSRYFNTKYHRKGPLWEGRFKRIWIGTDEQLLHLTRYIHLNPVTAHLVENPKDWPASSYREYLGEENEDDRVCRYDGVLDIQPEVYRRFVEDNIGYQRKLAEIKNLVLEPVR